MFLSLLTATMVLALLGLTLGYLLALAAVYLAVPEGDPLAVSVEALLPGSQCGQCGFAGCRLAAQAMAEGSAPIDCCTPGGRALAEQLAALPGLAGRLPATSAAPRVAAIRDSRCTGCTRCARACPTDAIVGANRQLHRILQRACSGCGKCTDACPEHCIELVPEATTLSNWQWPKPDGARAC